jgi:hypothetical protein
MGKDGGVLLKGSSLILTRSGDTHHQSDESAAKNIKTFGLRNQPSTVNVSQEAVRMG